MKFLHFCFILNPPARQPVAAECWRLSAAPRSQRRLGANLIICLINSNFWWNVSGVVSVSLQDSRGKQRSLFTTALLVLCEYKNDSDRISWIKSEHSQHTPSSSGSMSGLENFLNSHPCQNFFDYFNQIWKVTRSCCVHVDKIIWDGLVCQSLSISCQCLVLTEQ